MVIVGMSFHGALTDYFHSPDLLNIITSIILTMSGTIQASFIIWIHFAERIVISTSTEPKLKRFLFELLIYIY